MSKSSYDAEVFAYISQTFAKNAPKFKAEIKAINNPRTAEDLAKALMNPYSPLYKAMVVYLTEQSIEIEIFERLTREWYKTVQMEDIKEREALLTQEIRDAIATQQRVNEATRQIAKAEVIKATEALPKDDIVALTKELDQLEKDIKAIKANELTINDSLAHVIHEQQDTRKEWKEHQKQFADDLIEHHTDELTQGFIERVEELTGEKPSEEAIEGYIEAARESIQGPPDPIEFFRINPQFGVVTKEHIEEALSEKNEPDLTQKDYDPNQAIAEAHAREVERDEMRCRNKVMFDGVVAAMKMARVFRDKANNHANEDTAVTLDTATTDDPAFTPLDDMQSSHADHIVAAEMGITELTDKRELTPQQQQSYDIHQKAVKQVREQRLLKEALQNGQKQRFAKEQVLANGQARLAELKQGQQPQGKK